MHPTHKNLPLLLVIKMKGSWKLKEEKLQSFYSLPTLRRGSLHLFPALQSIFKLHLIADMSCKFPNYMESILVWTLGLE
jgi:hypothetical protein